MLKKHQNIQVSQKQLCVQSIESRNLLIGTLNCRGLARKEKVQQLCQDLEHFKLDILAVQETKIKGKEKISQVQARNGVWTENTWNTLLGSENTNGYNFCCGKCENSFHGVGFIVRNNLDFNFKSYSNRLALLTIYITYNDRKHPLNIINAYAPTSNSPINEIEEFYTSLEYIINKVNRKELLICGDFNTEIGFYNHSNPDEIGCHSNGKKSRNSLFLVDILINNELYACNTFFKHKLENIHTWTSSFIHPRRRNPYRCQLDYIIATKNIRSLNFEAKSKSRLSIDTDHKLVISKFKINKNSRRRIYPTIQNKRQDINVNHLKENKIIYNSQVEKRLQNISTEDEPQIYWNNLCEMYV